MRWWHFVRIQDRQDSRWSRLVYCLLSILDSIIVLVTFDAFVGDFAMSWAMYRLQQRFPDEDES